jgi:hypothetical protein
MATIGILCKKDGDPKTTMAIRQGDPEDSITLATWNSLEEAKDFAERHILCRISECIFIDLENNVILE